MSKFIENFLKQLDEQEINYLHWKSNTNIEKALVGEDDLDILVDPKDKGKIYQLFKGLNILRGYSEKDSWQNEIFHFFGLDVDAQKMIQIHLHFLLEVGYDFDKSVNLPIVQSYLESKNRYQDRVYIPSVENEYILLIIRLMLKNALLPFLLHFPKKQYAIYKRAHSKGVVVGSAYREYVDLRSRSDREALDKALDTTYPFMDKELFYACEEVIEKNSSLKEYFDKSAKMKALLQPYSYHTKFVSLYKSFFRINQTRLGKVLKNRVKSKKIPANGGKIIAFVGGDGAGKSSNIEKLSSVLSHHYFVKTIHIGRPNQKGAPKRYFFGRQIRNFGKLLMRFKLQDLGTAINHVGLAVERKQAFMKAQKIKAQGGIVILDRIPLQEVDRMDAPKIERELGSSYAWFAKVEKKLHTSISGVDQLIVLKLDPKIAIQRRPEDDADELLIRSGQIWNADFSKKKNTTVINTNNTFKYVEDRVLTAVWETLNRKPNIAEILGLAATGKSTVTEHLKETHPYAIFALGNKGVASFLLKNSYKYLKILLKSKSKRVKFFKDAMKVDIFLHQLKQGEIDEHRMFIFDQGAIFYTMKLMVEVPEVEELYAKELAELLSYYDKVVFLEAPLELLAQRINDRERHHRIKNLDLASQKLFLETHLKGYEKMLTTCRQQGVQIYRIDTHKNSIIEVEEKIDEIF